MGSVNGFSLYFKASDVRVCEVSRRMQGKRKREANAFRNYYSAEIASREACKLYVACLMVKYYNAIF